MPHYDFLPLSPPDFESLVGDLLQAAQGLSLERFGPGRDKGIDLRCATAGTTVVQCKHYHRSGASKLKSALRQEVIKWEAAHSVDRYILATSVSMSPQLKDDICNILGTVLPIVPSDVFGLEDLNSILDEHPRVERQHFKLWINSSAILDRFIKSGLWSRTEDLLESIGSRAKFFVQTAKYGEALDILNEGGVCVITGPPGVGKSLLAEMVLLAYSREGFEVVAISEDASEGYEAWKEDERQFFYYDDFLGQTSFAESRGKNEDGRLERFVSRVMRSDGKLFILTTRDQIFRSATSSSDRIRRVSERVGRETITLDDYDTYTKGEILFNHIYFSSLPTEDRIRIINEERYLDYIEHPNYSPRIVEQVLNRSSTDATAFYEDLDKSLANPEDLWIASYGDLSLSAQRLLRLMISYPTVGAGEELIRAQIKPADITSYTQALKVLEGTWIHVGGGHDGETLIEFANPSCRDFILHLVDREASLAEEAVSDAVTFDRLLLLRGYASSSSLERHDGSPGELTKAFTKMGRGIIGLLKEYYRDRYQTFLENIPFAGDLRLLIGDPRPSMLQQLLPVFRDVLEDTQWLSAQAEQLISDEENKEIRLRIRASDYLELSRAFAVGGAASEAETALLLLNHAMNHVDSLDDLSEFRDLAELQGLNIDDLEIRDFATEVLGGEVRFFETDCDDASQIFEGADAIQSLAEEFGLDFEYEATRLREIASEMPEDDSPMSGPVYRPSPVPDSKIPERQAVRDLFQGLVD